jgi:hypothetical protein
VQRPEVQAVTGPHDQLTVQHQPEWELAPRRGGDVWEPARQVRATPRLDPHAGVGDEQQAPVAVPLRLLDTAAAQDPAGRQPLGRAREHHALGEGDRHSSSLSQRKRTKRFKCWDSERGDD